MFVSIHVKIQKINNRQIICQRNYNEKKLRIKQSFKTVSTFTCF